MAQLKNMDKLPSPSNDNVKNEIISRDYSRLSLFSTSSSASQEEQFRCEGHAENKLTCMQNYLIAGKLCDVTLISGIGGQRVQAHRLVLSAASEYFSLMFTGSLRESNQSEITLANINGNVLQAIVNYCYTGAIEIREDNVEVLLETACQMQLHEIVEACSKFLANQLHPSNCLGIVIFAEHQSCKSLLNEANTFTSKNFMQVILNQEFIQLNIDQIINLLSNDDLNVTSEEYIFVALMKWIQYDPVKRKSHLGCLLGYVKLPLLSLQFIFDHIKPVIDGDPICYELILEALKWHLLPECRLEMFNSRMRPRKATIGRLLVIGGMDKNKGATTIECYDPRYNIWSDAYHMSGRRLQFGVALLSDKLLIVGGRDGLKTLNTMECLDLKTGVWTQLAPMNTHRHGLGVALLGTTLYAVGGHDGWSYLNNVERWDSASRSWSYVAPMQSQRCSAGVAVLNNKLYAVGGRDGSSCLKTVECYDPFINKWTMCASLSNRRGGVGVAVANGFLYAIGGQDAPANNPGASRFDCVEKYNPNTDTWTIVASLSGKRDAVAACVFGEKLVAVGGYDGSHYLKTVEQYDPYTQQWSTLAPLIIGRAGACITAVSSKQLLETSE